MNPATLPSRAICLTSLFCLGCINPPLHRPAPDPDWGVALVRAVEGSGLLNDLNPDHRGRGPSVQLKITTPTGEVRSEDFVAYCGEDGSIEFRPEQASSPIDPSQEPLFGSFERLDAATVVDGDRIAFKLIRHRRTHIVFVYVPGGRFIQGSAFDEAGHDPNFERPAREMEVSGYYIAKHETTEEQWARGLGLDPSSASSAPVSGKTWNEVADWCRLVGLGLPNELQWEYAASGPQNRKFPWGDEFEAGRANQLDGGGGVPVPVDSYRYLQGASWCEALHMAGNVYELTSEDWTQYHDGQAPEVDSTAIRGGAFDSKPEACRTSYRRRIEKGQASPRIGFRAVVPAKQVQAALEDPPAPADSPGVDTDREGVRTLEPE